MFNCSSFYSFSFIGCILWSISIIVIVPSSFSNDLKIQSRSYKLKLKNPYNIYDINSLNRAENRMDNEESQNVEIQNSYHLMKNKHRFRYPTYSEHSGMKNNLFLKKQENEIGPEDQAESTESFDSSPLFSFQGNLDRLYALGPLSKSEFYLMLAILFPFFIPLIFVPLFIITTGVLLIPIPKLTMNFGGDDNGEKRILESLQTKAF